MRVELVVDGRPPRKDGANSMWGQSQTSDAALVAKLREKALEARARMGMEYPFSAWVGLDLTVSLPTGSSLTGVGDLDTFIAGVCDALQAAPHYVLKNQSWHSLFNESGREAIHPRYPILIETDAKVVAIAARKGEALLQEYTGTCYKVTVEPVSASGATG